MPFVTIEDRVDRLEALFGQFMTDMALLNKRADDRDKAAEERNKAAEERNKAAEERNAAAEERNKAAEERMTRFEQEMHEFKDEMRQSKKDLDKKWGDLSNKLGHIIEDVLAPNLPRLAEEHFGFKSVLQFSIRILRKQTDPKVRWFEVDALVIGQDTLIVGEAKSTPSLDYANEFASKLKEFPIWFPEYKKHKIIGIFGSWSISPPVIERLTALGIYALAMGNDNMELLNATQLDSRK